jgi:hypothetical protein
MKERSLDSGFEKYRRERKRRQAATGVPVRPLGDKSAVRRELEKADAAEMADQRLTREVKEFFEDATRTAAEIVSKISELQEAAATERVSDEMHEFIVDAISRMEWFVDHLDKTGTKAEENLEPHMHNLVGPMLDSFRLEGTAKLTDQHIGQDPFASASDESPAPTTEKAPRPADKALDDFELMGESALPVPEVKKVRSLGETRRDGGPMELDLAPERVIDSGEPIPGEKDSGDAPSKGTGE